MHFFLGGSFLFLILVSYGIPLTHVHIRMSRLLTDYTTHISKIEKAGFAWRRAHHIDNHKWSKQGREL